MIKHLAITLARQLLAIPAAAFGAISTAAAIIKQVTVEADKALVQADAYEPEQITIWEV